MNDIASGDLDGDGIPEFVVGYNGGGGVRMLDADGRQRWQESDGNVWHVEIVDTDGNDKPEIVHSNASGQMIFRDSNGKVIRRAGVEGYFSQFAPVHWPPGQPGFLHVTDTSVDVLDFQGMPRVRLETPDLNVVLYEARGTAVRLGDRDYLVVSASAGHWNRGQLLVFDLTGALRYREVVPAECTAVAAPEHGAFLFGCESRLFRYSPAP
jgi:hypothetical protein